MPMTGALERSPVTSFQHSTSPISLIHSWNSDGSATMSGAGSSSCDGRSAIKSKYSPGSYSSSNGRLFGMLGGACFAWARSEMGGTSMNDTGSLGASTLGVMSSMGRFSAANFALVGDLSMYLSNTYDSSKIISLDMHVPPRVLLS